MKIAAIQYPRYLKIGNGSSEQFVDDFLTLGMKNLFVVTTPPVLPQIKNLIDRLDHNGINVAVFDGIESEPVIETVMTVLEKAIEHNTEAIVGIGGGSVMDTAKLVAALKNSSQDITELFGIGRLKGRSVYLTCIP